MGHVFDSDCVQADVLIDSSRESPLTTCPDNDRAGLHCTARVELLEDDVGQRGPQDPSGDRQHGTSLDETVEGLGWVSASDLAAVQLIECLPTRQDAMVMPYRRPLSRLISTATTSHSSRSWRCRRRDLGMLRGCRTSTVSTSVDHPEGDP